MRFATFNVLHGLPISDGRPAPFPRGESAGEPLARAVASLDADVLALQELDRFQVRSGRVDQAAAAAAASGARDWRYASAAHGRSVPGRGWVRDPAEPGMRVYGPKDAARGDGPPSHGIALATRLPVREWRARRLPPSPVGLPLRVPGLAGLRMMADQPRCALAAVLEGARGPFTVVAVHLSFVPGWNVGQLVAIRRWIAGLPRPHLLLGDLNLVGPVPPLALGGAWRTLARTRTYPSHRPVVQFDHVLAAGLGRAAVRSARAPAVPVSDHRPLVVDLEL
ncbi:endonuclease/exonuclease/phosphatase family protein [Actinacidiphila glaucinigra]|uniref:endonuclease/exonuclease/phosphatase family protein n=1 Tax=Actinacidiphila glaucinigra TaxID=235986 RepID=UPI0038690345